MKHFLCIETEKNKITVTEIINLNDPLKSTVGYDPMDHIRSATDIESLTTAIVHSVICHTNDDYWSIKSKQPLGALMDAVMNLDFEDVLYAPLGNCFIMQSGKKPVVCTRYNTLKSKEYKKYLNIINRTGN